MKLPRWLIGSMLVLSAQLAFSVAAWWWATWPERTIRAFVDQVAEDDLRPASDLIEGVPADWAELGDVRVGYPTTPLLASDFRALPPTAGELDLTLGLPPTYNLLG